MFMARVRPFSPSEFQNMCDRASVIIGLSIGTAIVLAGLLTTQQWYNATVTKTFTKIVNDYDYLYWCYTDLYKKVKMIRNSVHRMQSEMKHVTHDVNGIVDKQMALKETLADYALEVAGAHVISVQDTQVSLETAKCNLLGFSVCAGDSNPDIILQHSLLPGECWAFKGHEATVTIKLAASIFVENVSVDHIHKSLAPLQDVSSAPKKFSLWGLDSDTSDNKHLFGIFSYELDGPSVQTFPVQNPGLRPYKIVQFKVHSNHGNPKYTCVYKVRVHGKTTSINVYV